MKCISCTHPVSTEFSFAIEKNQCPKCGKKLMKSEVQIILSEMKSFMQEDKDLGDLAEWFLKKMGTATPDSLTKHDDEEDDDAPASNDDANELELVKPAPKPIQKSMLEPSRLDYFNKHARIDKMRDAIKEIQGKKDSPEYITMGDSDEDNSNWDINQFKNKPLSPAELALLDLEVSNIQEPVDPSEMNALKRIDGGHRK